MEGEAVMSGGCALRPRSDVEAVTLVGTQFLGTSASAPVGEEECCLWDAHSSVTGGGGVAVYSHGSRLRGH